MMQFQGIKKLTALLQSNDDDDDVNAPAATVFENSAGSGTIIESHNGLLDKANAQLEDARSTEKSSLRNFEILAMSLNDQIKYANKVLDEAKKAKAEAEEYKGTGEGDLGVTATDLNSMWRYCWHFEADDGCEMTDNHFDFLFRTRLRTGVFLELSGKRMSTMCELGQTHLV